MFRKIHIHTRYDNEPKRIKRIQTAQQQLINICLQAGCTVVDQAHDADIILALGGDGTVLSAAQLAIQHNKPIAGIYAGKLGFLTGYKLEEPENITELLLRPNKAQYLNTICVQHNQQTYYAINECLLHRMPNEQIGHVSIEIENEQFQVSVDGMMLTTATGSSGYALSAGGPLMHPSSNHLLLVAVAPHSLNARPMILPDDASIRMKQLSNVGSLYIDGVKVAMVSKDDTITCHNADKTLKIHHPDNYNYYQRVIQKLHWQST